MICLPQSWQQQSGSSDLRDEDLAGSRRSISHNGRRLGNGDRLNGQNTKAGCKGLQGCQEIGESHRGRIPGYLRETGEKDTIESWITPEYFDHYLRAQASYVAEIARELVGFILVQPTSFVHSAQREIWLEYIAVQPASRRKGIGTMLLSTVIDYA